jgi:Xaa-Pro aminopeptidase
MKTAMLFNALRAKSYMRRHQLDALIATSPVNITYFTDHSLWIDTLMKEYMVKPGGSVDISQGYALFPLEGDPALMLTAGLLAVNAVDIWVKDLRLFGSSGLDTGLPVGNLPDEICRMKDLLEDTPIHSSSTDALAGALKERGLSKARIGIEVDGLTPPRFAALKETLPGAQLLDCSNLIRLLRMVKSSDEVNRLTQAAEISERAAMDAMAEAKPGQNIQEVIHHFRAKLGEMNADLDHFAFGYHGLGIGTEPNFILGDSPVEFVDWGCIYRNCCSDTGTTLAMRPLSAEMQQRFDTLRACMDAGLNVMKPGVCASAIQAAMQDVVASAGYEMYPHGHGIGLEIRDYPIIAPANGLRIKDDCVDESSDLLLEPDMVLNLEAPLFMAGVGSLQLEQSVVITQDGHRPLTHQQRDIPIIL